MGLEVEWDMAGCQLELDLGILQHGSQMSSPAPCFAGQQHVQQQQQPSPDIEIDWSCLFPDQPAEENSMFNNTRQQNTLLCRDDSLAMLCKDDSLPMLCDCV